MIVNYIDLIRLLLLTLLYRCQHKKCFIISFVPTLINLDIRRFISKTVQVEFFGRLNGSVTSPVLIARLAKLRNKLHWPPDAHKRDYHAFPRAIASKITYELIHLDVRVCHDFCTGCSLEGLDVCKKGDTTTILFWSKYYSQLRDLASFDRIGQYNGMQKKAPS